MVFNNNPLYNKYYVYFNNERAYITYNISCLICITTKINLKKKKIRMYIKNLKNMTDFFK